MSVLFLTALLACSDEVDSSENSLPTVTSAAISPSPAYVGDTLTCIYQGFRDGDGDSDNCRIEWLINGLGAATGQTLAGGFVAGDTVECWVIPNDGTEDGEPTIDSLVIQNSLPELAALVLTPLDPDTDDVLTAIPAGPSDPDGQEVSLRYTWTVDGEALDHEGDSLDGAVWFDKGQVIGVSATPSDGEAEGAAVFAETAVVVNSPPTAPGVDITPAQPLAGEDALRCVVEVEAEDPDGDALDYRFEWTVDGALYEGAAETVYPGDTVPASATATGQRWVCTAWADDGEDGGASDAAAVTLTFPSVAAGGAHACALGWDRRVDCWGADDDGQVSDAPSGEYAAVAAGGDLSCALDDEGALSCWGSGDNGLLEVPDGAFAAVAVGDTSACALDSAGALTCWGSDAYGVVSGAPDGEGHLSVSVGGFHACAIAADGGAECWGNDNNTQVSGAPGFEVFTALGAGSFHTCGVIGDRSLRCWGQDDDGQVTDRPGGASFVDVVAGRDYSCALSESGAVTCWGSDEVGVLSEVPAGSFVQLAGGEGHACAVATDGDVLCWGGLGAP
jgi:hypothetical protein